MKIIGKYTSPHVSFDSLKYGDTFYMNGYLYLKLNVGLSYPCNAVCLSTNKVAVFNGCENVLKVETEIHVLKSLDEPN